MTFTHYQNKIVLYNDSDQVLAEVTFPNVNLDSDNCEKLERIVDVNHTFVDSSLRGQGIAQQLMLALAKQLQKENKKAILTCSYAKKWFADHPEYQELVASL